MTILVAAECAFYQRTSVIFLKRRVEEGRQSGVHVVGIALDKFVLIYFGISLFLFVEKKTQQILGSNKFVPVHVYICLCFMAWLRAKMSKC